jgi:hypothetical protein
MNISNITLSTSCQLAYFEYIDYYVSPVVSGFGIVTNLFSSIVFYRILKYEKVNSNMFKYLFFKAINDFIQFFVQIFSPVYFCEACNNGKSLLGTVWYIGFYYYIETINELASAWLETLATFDCLCFINNRFKFVTSKIFAIVVITGLHAYSAVFNLFWIFCFEIKSTISGLYKIETTLFCKSKYGEYLKYIHTIQRDLIVLILIVILNILILIKVKKTILKKKLLLSEKSRTSSAIADQTQQSNSKRAEKNSETMIVLIGANYFIGHVGILIYYLPFPAPQQFWSCFYNINLMLFGASYSFSNLIYYVFNNIYRKHAKHIINILMCQKK